MDPLSIRELLGDGDYGAVGGGRAICTGVSTDSRTIAAGDLFFALRGDQFDGHEFVAQALAAGAAAAVVEQGRGVSGRVIAVDDPLHALQAAAARYRRRFALPVIGITGSHGKTTVKDALASLLQRRWRVCKTPKNLNGQIGLPQALFNLASGDELMVVEMGVSIPGEMAALNAIARPTHGIVLGVAPVHTEFFGDLAGVLREKRQLADALEPTGEAFIHGDDPLAGGIIPRGGARRWRFGSHPHCEFRWSDRQIDSDGRSAVRLDWPGGSLDLAVPLIGQHNVVNAVAAAAAALRLGLAPDEVVRGVAELQPTPMRMALELRDGIRVLNDAYNAAPQSMAMALAALTELPVTGGKFAALGDMLELGPAAPAHHQRLGELAAQAGLAGIGLVGPLSRHTARAAVAAGFPAACLFHADTATALAAWLAPQLRPGDALLVKGSRGMRMESLIVGLFGRSHA